MKICAIICEFNPFHNGHKYIIEQARKLSGCDLVLCIMSGSFTQRGDLCISDKFTRARHAVTCGADAVIELPTAFSVSPAEIFASGAIKIINSIPDISTLCFGCENPNADFEKSALLLIEEAENFKKVMYSDLSEGKSFIKSYADAFAFVGGDAELLTKPNNILAVEYAKAAIKSNSKIALLPVKRVGNNFGDDTLCEEFSSASAIRKNLSSPTVKNNVPFCVYKDLKPISNELSRFEDLLRFKLLCSSSETLIKIYGCTEGLENNLINKSDLPYEQLINCTVGKRYTQSRIKRILLSNLLNIYADDCELYLKSDLYIKPLVIKNEKADAFMSALARADYPLIMRQRDLSALDKTAKKCLDSDIFSGKVHNFIFNRPNADFEYPLFI